ncbi:MAG: tRNA lysidine(34) synthetase TilS [Coriobacteriia bacterium]|nr:tRNA lysidine(34) synthetase TilS [Coriobacteriia bacterium]
MTALADIARETVRQHGMVPDACVVLAMVSGGADSVALLRLAAEGVLGAPSAFSVLHVNHCLRGAEADADEAFVLALCDSLGIQARSVRYDVTAYAEAEGLNLEDAGRRIRYSLAESELDRCCAAAGVHPREGRVATAHTFDDRLETFLARLATGAGSAGLRSIAPVRGRVVRPLIDAGRADVTAYLTGLGQPWREDATNADTSRQRAWVRHDLLPVIERRSPAFRTTMSRTLRILAEEDDLLAEMAAAFSHDFAQVSDGVLGFDRSLMQTLTRPMARRTVRGALIDAFPEASRLEFEHTEAIVDGLADEGFARDLPFGLRAETEYGRLNISRKEDVHGLVAPGLLGLPGRLDLGAAGVIEAREVPLAAVAAGADTVTIDTDAVAWPLLVDSMRDGDRIRPFGMTGTKKVGDLLTDAKVPRRLRGRVPVLRDGDRVVWVAGVRLAEDVRVTAETARAAELTWHRPGAGTNPLSE